MADEKDRLGDKFHQAGRAREEQWARQLDAEIIERLRRKYAKPIHCPQCDKNLDARVAIGLGGMACPKDHGAWADDETLRWLAARLKNVAAIRQDSAAEKPYIRVGELADELRHKHPAEIYCPDCGSRLEAEAAVSAGAVGLTGIALAARSPLGLGCTFKAPSVQSFLQGDDRRRRPFFERIPVGSAS